MFGNGREPDMAGERERAKAGGYKTGWLIEDLEGQHREVIAELETLLNARVEPAEMYRLIGRAIVKLHKANDTVRAIRRIYE